MLTIGSKLGLGIGVLLVLCILIGIVSYEQARHVRQKVEEMTEVKEPLNTAVYGLENNLMETAFSSLGYLSRGDTGLLAAFQRSMNHFSAIQQQYRNAADADSSNGFNERLQEGFARLHAVALEQIRLRDQQTQTMQILLMNLDTIDALLSRRIQGSISADDPLAYRRLKAALEMEVNVNAIIKGLGNFLLTGQPQFKSRIRKAELEFKRYFRVYQYVLLSSEEKRWAAELRPLSNTCIALGKEIIGLERQRDSTLTQFFMMNRELESMLSGGIQLRTEASLGEAKRDVVEAGETANAMVIVVLLLSVVFGVGAGILTTRSITRPLEQLSAAMYAIAHGDRMQTVNIRSGEDLRSVGEAFNLMTSQLIQANEELRAEIAERKRAEEALRVSEERFRLSIESVKDYAIFMLDPEGCVASWNVGAERMKGYQPDQVIGRHHSIFYPDEDVQSGKPESCLARATIEGRVEDEGWRLRSDGSRFWANVVITAVRDESGSLRGFSKVTRDATERMKMEEKLRESELRFRTIFEEAPIGIALSDADGRFIQTNPILEEMVGDSGSALRGRLFAEVISPVAAYAIKPSATQIRPNSQGRYKTEIQWRRNDRNMAWLSLNVSPMHTNSARESYNIVMIEDITERKTAEQQIRMLAHTITSMNESVVITDAADRILSVNPAFLQSYGYDESEVIGRNADMLQLRTADGDMPESTLKVIRAGGWTGELITTRKDGEDFSVLLSTSVVRNDNGAPIALVAISRDITGQKRLQEQLEEAQQQRSAALRQFAVSVQRAQEEERARISRELHDDLCQRLSGMKFTVEVLSDDVQPLNKRVFRRLREVTRELDRTISEVRRISSNLRPSVLDDFGLVIAIKLLCKEFQTHHGIRATLHVDHATPRRLDENIEIAMYRIAQEALSNIAKHANATAADLHLILQNASIRLRVKDNGKGFDRNDTSRAKDSGHGLGLMIMRERSELLGGTFEVEAKREQGTTISVTIPLGEQKEYEED